VAAALATLLIPWAVSRGRKNPDSVFATAEVRQAEDLRQLRLDVLNKYPMTPIAASETSRIKSVLAGSLKEVDSTGTALDSQRLDANLRESLISRITAELTVRASADSAEYLRFADSQCSKWIEPGDRAWGPIDARSRFVLGDAQDRSSPRELLGKLLQFSLDKDGSRLTAVGADAESCKILVSSTRADGVFNSDLLAGAMPRDQYMAWFACPTHGGMRFRKPMSTPEEVLARDGIVIFADVANVVETEKRERYVLQSKWYWDPACGAWQNIHMFRKGPELHVMHY